MDFYLVNDIVVSSNDYNFIVGTLRNNTNVVINCGGSNVGHNKTVRISSFNASLRGLY